MMYTKAILLFPTLIVLPVAAQQSFIQKSPFNLDSLNEWRTFVNQCTNDPPPATCHDLEEFIHSNKFQRRCRKTNVNKLDLACIIACEVRSSITLFRENTKHVAQAFPDNDFCDVPCEQALVKGVVSKFDVVPLCTRRCAFVQSQTGGGSTPDFCVELRNIFAGLVVGIEGCESDQGCDILEETLLPACRKFADQAEKFSLQQAQQRSDFINTCAITCGTFEAEECALQFCEIFNNFNQLDDDAPILPACAKQCVLNAGQPTGTPDSCVQLTTLFADDKNGCTSQTRSMVLGMACDITENTLGVACELDGRGGLQFDDLDRKNFPCSALCDFLPKLNYC